MSRSIPSALPRYFRNHLSPPKITRRHQHTISAAEAAQSLLSRFQGVKSTTEQIPDGTQLQKLSLTLNRSALYPDLDVSRRTPPDNTLIPPGYHLVYFTPGGVEEDLGPDGTDARYNAPYPFTRRMWAGGKMRWEGGGGLRVGQEVRESTTLLSALPKVRRDGLEMVLVQVRKEFENEGGVVLVDEQSWIFRPEATVASPAASKAIGDFIIRGPSTVKDIPQVEGYPKRELRWSPTGLFRFSALTFNGHKIHYDPAWSTAVEGHAGCVVHGPMNLICMLDYWRDHCQPNGRVLKEIEYRALAPIYAGETYDIGAERMGDDKWEVLVRKDGKVCMRGEILAA
ncbi:hypothetical protein F5B22DRAFT_647818 [Xylaria bambusicola]|uniref:uncharacterized protein n=1 Tax=Xylaria bambusicola TaxID=326684 RepID=UPI0020089271|nr:uncharacterized protein F5B22DRAFT_647818 [Xylaria bambusicola]KAI0513273.1 hypothetical protein F5B22DRAFT_647818 [Xylaria bambusicola]